MPFQDDKQNPAPQSTRDVNQDVTRRLATSQAPQVAGCRLLLALVALIVSPCLVMPSSYAQAQDAKAADTAKVEASGDPEAQDKQDKQDQQGKKEATSAAANASASTDEGNGEATNPDTKPATESGSEKQADPKATTKPKLGKLAFPESKSASVLDLDDLAKQLPAVLQALSQPRNPQAHKVARKLDALARESSDLAKLLPSPTGKLRARHLELQAYNALANRAQQSRQLREASYRVSQIRSAALGARDLDLPQAHALADFWLLQADLFDINRSDATIAVRQRRAMQRLERFLAERETLAKRIQAKPGQANGDKADAKAEQNPVGDRLHAQVELALLRLYDQQGLNDKALPIVARLSQSKSLTQAERTQVAQDFAYLQTLGQYFKANLALSNGKPWLSQSHRGKAIVIVLYADGDKASQDAHNRLKAISASLQVRGIATLSVKVQGATNGTTLQNETPAAVANVNDRWPVYEEATGRVHLSRMFAVRSLPRYVLIDTQGKIHAIAGSDAVLQQLKDIQPAKPGPLK